LLSCNIHFAEQALNKRESRLNRLRVVQSRRGVTDL